MKTKTWIIVAILGFIITLSVYNYELINQHTSLPSEGISKELNMYTSNQKGFDYDNYSFVSDEEFMYLVMGENKSVNIIIFDKDGNKIDSYDEETQIEASSLTASKVNDKIFIVINENGRNSTVNFDLKTKTFTNVDMLSESVKYLYNDLLLSVMVFDKGFLIQDNNGQEIISNNDQIIKDFNAKNINGSTIVSFIVDTGGGNKKLISYYYDGQAIKFQEKPLWFTNSRRPEITYNGKEISIIVPNNEISQNNPKYELGVINFDSIKFEFLDNYSIFMDVSRSTGIFPVDNQDGLIKILMPYPVLKGSKNNTYNIVQFDFNMGHQINRTLISKTDYSSLSPKYFSAFGEDYYVWMGDYYDTKYVNLASSNETIIDMTTKISFKDSFMIFISSLVSLFTLSVIYIILFVSIALISWVYLILSVAFLKKGWFSIEKNKFYTAVGILFVMKIIYTYNYIMQKYSLLSTVPEYLRNNYVILLLLAVITIFTLYVTHLFRKNDIERDSAMQNFLVFSVLDVLYTLMLIYPYSVAFQLFNYAVTF
jgi:hypothetical protein